MACLLLVDDEAHVTGVLARRLEERGHEVHVARDGEEGLQLAQEHLPDLVVTDLQMPYVNGLEMAAMLRGHEALAQTPVVMLTARGYIVEPEELARTNIVETHSKPFGVRRMTDRIEELLEDRGLDVRGRGASRGAA